MREPAVAGMFYPALFCYRLVRKALAEKKGVSP